MAAGDPEAWTAWVSRASPVPSGRKLHGISTPVKRERATCHGRRCLGRPSSLVEPLRLSARYSRFRSCGVQEDPARWDRRTHAGVPIAA